MQSMETEPKSANTAGKPLAKAPTIEKPLFAPNPLPTRSFGGVRTPSPKGISTHFTPISREEIEGYLARIKRLERYTLEATQILRDWLQDVEYRVSLLEGHSPDPYREFKGSIEVGAEKWVKEWPKYLDKMKDEDSTAPARPVTPLIHVQRAHSTTPTGRDQSPDRREALHQYQEYGGLNSSHPSVSNLSQSNYSGSVIEDSQDNEYHQAREEIRQIASLPLARLSRSREFDSVQDSIHLNSYDRPSTLDHRQTEGPYHTQESGTSSSGNLNIAVPKPPTRTLTTWGDTRRNPFIEPRPPSPVHVGSGDLRRRQTLWPGTSRPTNDKLENVDLEEGKTAKAKDESKDRDSSRYQWLNYLPSLLGGTAAAPPTAASESGDIADVRFVRPEDLAMGDRAGAKEDGK